MFNTSRDILNLILAVCIVGFTVFICWLLYYLIAASRSFYRLTKGIDEAVDKISNLVSLINNKIEAGAEMMNDFKDRIDDLFLNIKHKLNHSSSYLMIIGEVLQRIFGMIKNRNERRSRRDDDAPEDFEDEDDHQTASSRTNGHSAIKNNRPEPKTNQPKVKKNLNHKQPK